MKHCTFSMRCCSLFSRSFGVFSNNHYTIARFPFLSSIRRSRNFSNRCTVLPRYYRNVDQSVSMERTATTYWRGTIEMRIGGCRRKEQPHIMQAMHACSPVFSMTFSSRHLEAHPPLAWTQRCKQRVLHLRLVFD